MAVLVLGAWLPPACAKVCANPASEASCAGVDVCGGAPCGGQHSSPKSDGCQARPFTQLQAGVQTNVQSDLASHSPGAFHLLGIPKQISAQMTGRARPLLAVALGPPVPPPLFTVLRT